MISVVLILTSVLVISDAGLITHAHNGDYSKATSYQNIHMEHFHAVPTYVKKEFKHLLEHPISVGKSASKVEIHHGDKHDHGYAITDNHHVVNENSFEKDNYQPSHLLTHEEYSQNNYGSDDNSQDANVQDNDDHQAVDQSQQDIEQQSYNDFHYGGDSVGHGSSSGLGHYQPVMYVLQYQNKDNENAVYEHEQ